MNYPKELFKVTKKGKLHKFTFKHEFSPDKNSIYSNFLYYENKDGNLVTLNAATDVGRTYFLTAEEARDDRLRKNDAEIKDLKDRIKKLENSIVEIKKLP